MLSITLDERGGDLGAGDIGKICLYHPQGLTLAVADTLAECARIAQACTGHEPNPAAICTTDDWDGKSLCAARIVTGDEYESGGMPA